VGDVAVVCGAGGALGTAIVEALLARGDSVVAVDQKAGDSREGVRHEACDLTSADEVAALWSRLAADEVAPRWVVNVAGGFRSGRVEDADPESLRFLEDLNLGTAWWSCREAALHLPAGGGIVNVGSRTAVAGGAGAAAYAVTKAAVVRLTEVLAAELAERRVRANAVLPSTLDTPANRASLPESVIAKAVAPADLASVIGFLLSDAAAAVTGAIVPVYGFGVA
jgi:NAD(P)-dependent dehydrogenase (short-subunit alcohol dehydrogenase family)